jgi:hypothetical protein
VWDARASSACTEAFDVWAGASVPPSSKAAALRCLRSPPATAVRFSAGGEWLVAGSGGGRLALWGVGLGPGGGLAKQLDTGGCAPQVRSGAEPNTQQGRPRRLRHHKHEGEEVA